MNEQVAANLAATLAPVLGPDPLIEGLEQLSGGASRETWRFTATGKDGVSQALILRRDPPGRPGAEGSMRLEADSMRACAAAGLRAPTVLVDDDGSTLGTAGLVMGAVPGETLARRILRDDEFAAARTVLVGQLGEFFAGLHAIDPTAVPGIKEVDNLTQYWTNYEGMSEVSPTFEAAYRWLTEHRPPTSEQVIVHGDLRLGNVIVGPEGLAAVIDWELVHLGDPLEDLAWLCVKAWRFGSPLAAAGVGTIEELVAAYEAASGRTVDRAAFDWWLVMNTLKWGIGCMGQGNVHLSGTIFSMEHAAIGRRVCEQEWDLLELIAPDQWAAARAVPEDQPVVPAAGLHGRPTALELLDAVRGWLADDVLQGTQGRIQFHSRVANNMLAMVERELQVGPVQQERFAAALAGLGVDSVEALGAAIRSGRFDGQEERLYAVLSASVRDRLSVANPRHLAR